MNVGELEIWPAGRGVEVNTWPTWEETEVATTNLELWVEENIYSGKFFVLFPSCRSAIYHILYAEGLSRADSVSISKWSSHCVISAVGRLAEPAIESSKKSKTVLINHQYGIHKMLKDADDYSLIIEDSCDSLICEGDNFCLNGGRYEVLSLPKIFGTGWGGGVIAKNYEDAEKLRKLRDEKKYAYAKEQFRLKQLYYDNKQENQWTYRCWGNNDAENVYLHPAAIQQIKRAFEFIDVLKAERLCRICQFLGEEKTIVEAKYKKRIPPVISIKYDEEVERKLKKSGIILPVRMVNTSEYADVPIWERKMLIPIHQDITDEFLEQIHCIEE